MSLLSLIIACVAASAGVPGREAPAAAPASLLAVELSAAAWSGHSLAPLLLLLLLLPLRLVEPSAAAAAGADTPGNGHLLLLLVLCPAWW
jgi:hypothetical protein